MADSESPASSAAAWLEKGKAAIGKDKEGGGKDPPVLLPRVRCGCISGGHRCIWAAMPGATLCPLCAEGPEGCNCDCWGCTRNEVDKGKGNDPGNDFEKDAKRLKQGGGSFLFLSDGSRAAAQKALNTSPILVQSSSDGDASGDFGPSDDEPAAT